MPRARAAWDGFWFAPAPAEGLALCRIAFAAGLLALVAGRDYGLAAGVDPVFHGTLPLFRSLGLTVAAPATAAVLGTLWKVSLAALALGAATRLAAVVSFALGVYLLGLEHTTMGMQHHDGAVVLALGVLAVSRCGDAWSLDRVLRRGPRAAAPPSGEYRWPVRMVWVGIAAVFFAAGFSKLLVTGAAWVFSDHLRLVLLRHHYRLAEADPWVDWGVAIARTPWLAQAVAASTLAIELAYPLVFVSRRARRILAPAGFALLIGFRALLGPRFYPLCVVHVFWLPWDRIAAAARGAWDGAPWRRGRAEEITESGG